MNAVQQAVIRQPVISDSSTTAWLPSLLLMLTLVQGTSVTLTLAVRLVPGSSATALVTLLWLLCYGLAVALLFSRHGIEWLGWLIRFRLPLLLLIAGAMASIAWSMAPGLTTERSIHLVGSTLIAVAIGFSLPVSRIMQITVPIFGVLMLANVVAVYLLPELGIENYEGQPVWRGVMASKNTLGFWAAIACLLFATRLLEERRPLARLLLLAALGLSLLNLVESASATSLLALGIAAMAMIYVHVTRSLSLSFLAASLLGVLMLGLSAMAFQYIDTAELIGRSGDLTGRGDLWSQVWALVVERPLQGYGYGTIWYPTDESLWIQRTLLDLTWTSYHAHNGLLQLASELGLPLTILVVVYALMQLIEVVYCHQLARPAAPLFVLGFCIALLVSNYSEARLLVNRELYWIFFVALPLGLMRHVISVPSGPAHVNVLRRLSPTVRANLLKKRQEVINRAAIKKRLLPRNSRSHRMLASVIENTQSTDKAPTRVGGESKPRQLPGSRSPDDLSTPQ